MSGRLPPLVERYLTWALPSGHDLAVAEAYRYLAELPWAPYALGTNPELRWREVGGRAVEVWAAMSGEQPTVRIEFDTAGQARCLARGRERSTAARFQPAGAMR